ncbi:MAG: hypothetical protein RIC06_22180 [Cyclobacteriaceae bacterium]
MKLTGLLLLTICLVFALRAQVPSAINFQGNLTDPLTGNAIVDGSYDMNFALFDADVLGSQLWSESQLGVSVQSGLFNVILGSVNQLEPFVFDQPVWLEITVSGETLSPRIELAATAYSINSANTQSYESPYTSIPSVGPAYIAGDTSTQNYPFGPPTIDLAIDDNDTGFDVLGDGNLSFYTNGQERMTLDFLGSLYMGTPISGGSGLKFEINYDDIGTDWGGMYISNSATTARPYYGYANGNGLAYTYLDGVDGNKWKLYNSGEHLTVQPNGNVGIGTTTPTEKLSVNGKVIANDTVKAVGFKYNTSRTLYYNLSPQEFVLNTNNTSLRWIASSNTNFIYMAATGGAGADVGAIAPLHLPQGAIITGIRANVYDGDITYDLSMDLARKPAGGSASNIFVIASTPPTSGSPGFTSIQLTGLSVQVNNATNSYHLVFRTRDNNPTLLVLYDVQVTYTVNGPY